MLNSLRPAIVLLLLFTALTSLAYPLAVTGIAAMAFPARSEGSLVRRGNVVIGSSLIGQNFRADRYFWPRPSATAEAPYNAAASSGSNLGPTSARLKAMVEAEAARLRAAGIEGRLPVDAVTASGSGLDPDISPDYARLQIARIAALRGLDPVQLHSLVARQTETAFLGVFGEARVNVLALNLALDSMTP